MSDLATERDERTRARAPRSKGPWPELAAAATGAAAALAPAGLTGHDVIDALQRAFIVAFVAYVGAHARRWSWMVAALAVAVPARGASLLIVLASLTILVPATVPQRRPKALGALGLGVLLNAPFWYPEASVSYGPALALAACALLVIAGLRFVRSRRRRYAKIALIGATVVVVLAGLGAAVALLAAQGEVRRGGDAAQAALDAARDGEAEQARTALRRADGAFASASSWVDGPLALPARLVPGLSQQMNAVQVTVAQGSRIAETADDLVATADYDDLKYEGQLDLQQVRALAGPTRRADQVLAEAELEMDDVRSGSLLPFLRDKVEEFDDKLTEARRDTRLAATLLEVTPALLGGDGTRRYLVVFVTPAELRGAGGFIGSYAELTAVDGDVSLTRSGRIADLIFAAPQGARTITGPDDYIDRYGRFNPTEFVQDATFSPHFPSDGDVLRQLYPQSGGSAVDGVISVDPTGLAALLELTGPVTVEGLDRPLSADNAVQLLTVDQYVMFPDEAQRGDILTEAVRVTFDQLTTGRLPAPRRIADALSPATRSGHLRMWSPEDAEQALFADLGADGSLTIPDGSDGFSVIQQNAGNNKIDAYLQRTISYDATVDAATGELRATMRIELANEVPSLDLPAPVVANSRAAPLGSNVTWVTVFSRHHLVSATLDGKPVGLGRSQEVGLNAFDSPLLSIPPGGKVVLELQLTGGVDLRDPYHLRITPQPVANPDRFTATLQIENGEARDGGSSIVTILDDRPVTAPTDRFVDVER